MNKYKLRLTLLSDLCVSYGGVYNSALDTDICYDQYGLPFIPAKRIKGCLRESALELCDWKFSIDVNKMNKLFGNAGTGTNKGIVRISNAYLEGYENIKKEISMYKESCELYHEQNILNHYSYVRTQTSIDYDTGVADEGGLRTMRVARKGLVFIADVDCAEEIDCKTDIDKLDNTIGNGFRLCVSNFSSMGIARTRGLGEIKAELLPVDSQEDKFIDKENDLSEIKLSENDLLEYTIELKEPIVCKSINGGQSNSMDYIEGSKILGLVIKRMKNDSKEEEVWSSILDGVCFSNAYISDGRNRFTEVPAYIYGIKNNSKEYINKILEKQIEVKEGKEDKEKLEQFNQMKHTYVAFDVDNALKKLDVMMTSKYHHTRPDDKSVGRAKEDNGFFTLSSICEGQYFKGFIAGDKNKLEQIAEIIKKETTCYLGYGNTAEYGKCNISVNILPKKVLSYENKIIVKLNSPTIIYNDKAMYTTDKEELLAEIMSRLGLKKEVIDTNEVDFYVNYTTVGGYNVTWNHRKPHIAAFDKGTAVIFSLNKEMKEKNSIFFIGERTKEGYGECELIQVNENEDFRFMIRKNNVGNNKGLSELSVKDDMLIKVIADERLKSYIKDMAASNARNDYEKILSNESNKKSYNSTVSNMLLMCKDEGKNPKNYSSVNTIDKISEAVKARYEGTDQEVKNNKMKMAEKILGNCKKQTEDILKKFAEKYKLLNYETTENIQLIYVESYLIQMKYMIRQVK